MHAVTDWYLALPQVHCMPHAAGSSRGRLVRSNLLATLQGAAEPPWPMGGGQPLPDTRIHTITIDAE
ncbi:MULTISPECIES: hypothetical protein [unclassified Acidovorax]|uniref:hypothetical protein n=1 Tax=unclassified Acidovorax TaxID=2684926 RepID=UPI002104AF86|nr:MULTISPECIES: hypothetical protein [unclassified Acidovorax]